MITVEEFQKHIKKERDIFFNSSYERAYKCFLELGYDKKSPDFFENNASDIVIAMREQCWNDFIAEEEAFTIKMLKDLIPYAELSPTLTPEQNVEKYVEAFPEHIYQLNLSNTQSRRSRAGKEFEHILELILIGANISLDSQGNIGKDVFVTKGLGKLVDIVAPGVIEFDINKRDTVLISAKTTLRERWQEVPEEMGRTGASEMFLATLDESVTKNVLNTLYEANIQLTTTKQNKDKNYPDNKRVLSFEQLIQICKEVSEKWIKEDYTEEIVYSAEGHLQIEISKHEQHSFVKSYLLRRLQAYRNNIN